MAGETMPDWLEPMAATLTQDRFSGGEWVFERKFDGIRLLSYKRGPAVRLFSRNRLPQHLPDIAAAVTRLPVDEAILEGELAWDVRASPLEALAENECEASQEFVVGGFTDPQGTRVGLGALLVGYYEGVDLVFAGKIGTGFDTKPLLGLRRRLDAIELPASPFTRAMGLPRIRAHWVRPEIVVQAAFIEWTVHGKLRLSCKS